MMLKLSITPIFLSIVHIRNVYSFTPFISKCTGSRLNLPPTKAPFRKASSSSLSQLYAYDGPIELSQIPDNFSYTISSRAPLGIILSEFQCNTVPELTPLIVSDVTEMSNGAMAGVREGDILLGVNGLTALAIGAGFTEVMDSLIDGFQNSPSNEVSVTFFRGSTMGKEDGFDGFIDLIVNGEAQQNAQNYEYDDTVNDIDTEDEDYEPPNISDYLAQKEEEKRQRGQVGAGQLFSSLIKETADAVQKGLESSPQQEQIEKESKKSGGLFGMFSQETVQLEDSPNAYNNPLDDQARERNGEY